jgi:hypothetical protein
MVCSCCGVVGAYVRPNRAETGAAREPDRRALAPGLSAPSTARSSDARYRGQAGKHALSSRFTGVDPERTSRLPAGCKISFMPADEPLPIRYARHRLTVLRGWRSHAAARFHQGFRSRSGGGLAAGSAGRRQSPTAITPSLWTWRRAIVCPPPIPGASTLPAADSPDALPTISISIGAQRLM